jgi:hypothetical protein
MTRDPDEALFALPGACDEGATQRADGRFPTSSGATTSAIRLADPAAIRLADPRAIRFADPMRIS